MADDVFCIRPTVLDADDGPPAAWAINSYNFEVIKLKVEANVVP
jgi:hypothetical protein